MRIFTNLKLDGSSSVRARPRLGEWGPAGVPSTRRKRWQRVIVPIVFVIVATAVVLLGWYFYRALSG